MRAVEITLISALKPCAKCEACRQIVRRLEERYPGQIASREVRADDPEAAQYGVVLPPMLLLGDVIVAFGRPPREEKLAAVIATRLKDGTDE